MSGEGWIRPPVADIRILLIRLLAAGQKEDDTTRRVEAWLDRLAPKARA